MEENGDINSIKEKIIENVKIYYKKKFGKKPKFVPGESLVRYGGRIFDEHDLINLVESSLEFWLTEGDYTKRFNKELASYLGLDFCLCTTSGSSANLLAISALTSKKIDQKRRLRERDEIITVAAGFPTTIFPIIQNKAVPVFVDIELKSYNIDISKLDLALTDKTKAVILAHTLGNPFNVDQVVSFCEDNNLWLIEDNCDALGSKYRNKYTGTFGDISTCSFYPAHHITMGEGGAILTNNSLFFKILRSLREWGRDCWCPPGNDNTCKKRFEWQLGTLPYGYDHKYTYSEFGYNLKITDMQAAIGLAQLEKLPKFIEARRKNHSYLYEGLKDYEDIIILPEAQEHSVPSWFGFIITLKKNINITRNEIIYELEKRKIQTRLLFAGNIICQPVFNELRENNKGFKTIGMLNNTDKVMNDSFWIGVYPGISKDELDYMLSQICEILQ